MPTHKTLFLLEDSKLLSDAIARQIQRMPEWRLILARCVDDAKEMIHTIATINAAMIDLMIPETKDVLNTIDSAMNRREELSMELATHLSMIMPGHAADEYRRLQEANQQEKNRLDRVIRDKTPVLSGVSFLMCREAQPLRERGVRVAVFSALRNDEVYEGKSWQDRVNSAISPNLVDRWFEKPANLPDIRNWIIS